MKIVDVDLLQDGLKRKVATIERLKIEIENIERTVRGLVEMADSFKGEGADAIRAFYADCHLPFLHFFQVFSDNYLQKLSQIESALHSMEPSPAGYISQEFLEGELEQGLTFIGNLTEALTDEANSIMDTVSDIIALPHLDDSGVQIGVLNAKKRRDDTVRLLNEFDFSQTALLDSIEQDIQTMSTWLTDLELMFTAGLKDIAFQPSQWNAITFGSAIRTELFPKVYLDPNSLWVEEREKMIGTIINAKTFQALESKRMNTIEENVGENIKYHQYANGLLIKEYTENGTVYYEIVSKVEYKEEVVQAEKPKGNKLLDGLQLGLDLVGLVPGIGEIADGLNGVIYTARGDKVNAALSFSAMIPIAGWGSTGAKFANKGTQLYQSRNVLSKEKVGSIVTPTYQEVVNAPLGRTQANMNMFKTDVHNMTPKSVTFNSTLTVGSKGIDNANSKIRVVDGKKEYNVNGKWLTDKQFSVLRQKAVRQAWKAEKELIQKTGRGSRDWTPGEMEELLTTGKVKGYEGQHMKSANEYPDFAGEPDNIQFLKGRTMDVNEHLDAHRGSYHNPTNGFYDPNTGVMIEFGDKVPWK